MTRTGAWLATGALLAVMGWGAWSWRVAVPPSELVYEPVSSELEPSPVCPWRQPEIDLRAFFPEATRQESETRILSHKRLELQKRLGRPLSPDELSLRVYRIYGAEGPIGSVLTRRVKGEHGVIEIVLGVREDKTPVGLRLQRLREPENIAQALEDPQWLHRFIGQGAQAEFLSGEGIREFPERARESGRAILEGVRSALIMLEMADLSAVPHVHH